MYTNNIIKTFSSWSLIPLHTFCNVNKSFHLYKLTGGCRGLNECNTGWLSTYEYEVILVPGTKFIEYKTQTLNNLSNDYIYKKYVMSNIANIITIHYIKIINM